MTRLLLGCALAAWLLLHWAPVEYRVGLALGEFDQFSSALHNVMEGGYNR